MSTLPELGYPAHEFVAIEVGSEGADAWWVCGLRSPGGEKVSRYEEVFIASRPTREAALGLGEAIARVATMERLVLNIAGQCNLYVDA